jgi:O-antigen/teichoic acid export membrane protein
LLIGLLMTVVLWGSAPLLPLFIGRGFAESVLALRWLALLPLLRSAHIILGSILTTAGFQHYRTAFQLAIAGFNFMLNLWLIPLHGWRGAVWASLATDGLLGVVYWLFACWQLHRTVTKAMA